MKTLLLAPRYDDDSQLLWQEAVRREDWSVVRLGGYHARESFVYSESARDVAAIYGGHIFGREVARQLGIDLLSPPADWLTTLPADFLKREVHVCSLGGAFPPTPSGFANRWWPTFVKSLHWPQDFASRIYYSPDDLPALGDDVQVLASEPVHFTREFRAFCLDANILTFSPYSRGPEGELDTVLSRADVLIAEECHGWLVDALQEIGDTLPRAVVIDVGMLADGKGPAIVEANPAWCSGVYTCDPGKVLDVVEACVVRREG
jgi:hypothetical protein